MTVTAASLPSATKQIRTRWHRLPVWRKAQLAALLLASLVLLVLGSRQSISAQLVLDAQLSAPGAVQVFFDQGNGYNEAGSFTTELAAGSSRLQVPLPAGRTNALRLDPPAEASEFSIDVANIMLSHTTELLPLTSHPLNELMPQQGDAQRLSYRLKEGATDPQLLLSLPTPVDTTSVTGHQLIQLGWVLVGCCIVLIVGLQMACTLSYRWPVAACTAMVLALACFAVQSKSVSPDEDLHEAGARYFSTHWLPPRLDSSEMLPSYKASSYGVSYLSEWNVTYLFAGKAGNLATSAGLSERQGYRLYQASLLLLLIGAVALLRLSPFSLVPILVTPQAWYVFSYMNGDALPLAAASLAAGIALTRDSPLRAYLMGERRAELKVIAHALVFAACLAMMLVSKRNYWPIGVFIVCAMAVSSLRLPVRSAFAIAFLCTAGILWNAAGTVLQQHYNIAGIVTGVALVAMAILGYDGIQWLRRRHFSPAYRLAAVFTLSIALAAPWISTDVMRNGAGRDKAELVEQLRETHAAPAFKPSADQRSPGLRMHEEGYLLPQMLKPPLDWHVGTAKSLFGVYGYMQYYATTPYYMTIWATACLLVLLAFCTTATAQPPSLGQSQLALAIGAAASLVGASLLHSWTYDFQAQGRYILGISVLLGAQLSHLRPDSLLERMAHVLVAAAVVMGVYSYAVVALPNLTP